MLNFKIIFASNRQQKLRIVLILLAITFFTLSQGHGSRILLDPTGHANYLGRKLSSGYERGATLSLAEELQKMLLTTNVKVILSRGAGEVIYPLQIPSFANRLKVSCVINIHIYHTTQEKPKIHFYHLCYNPFIEFSAAPPPLTAFIPLDKAHLVNLKKSAALAKQLQQFLAQDSYAKQWEVFRPIGMPLKPLIGIIPPSVIIEIGSNDKQKLATLIPALAESISLLDFS